MISVKRNKNFTNWVQVFYFGKFIDELNSMSRAVRLAESLAKKEKQKFINIEGEAKIANT